MDEDGKYCKICYSAPPRYVCPRCGLPYCSTKCYQNVEKHSRCSEDFYRRCVEEELKSQSTSTSTSAAEARKAKVDAMNKILERLRKQDQEQEDLNQSLGLGHSKYHKPGHEDKSNDSNSDSDSDTVSDEFLDSDDDEPLSKRLGDLDLEDSEKVWDVLTEEEKEGFQKMVEMTVAQGDVEAVAEPWYPGRKLIQELSSSSVSPPNDSTNASLSSGAGPGPGPESSASTSSNPLASAASSRQV